MIEIILGRQGRVNSNFDTNTKLQRFTNFELVKQESLFTTLEHLKINVSSWNLGGVKPFEDIEISKWLFPFDQNYLPDLFVVGFQEIIPLTAKNIV